MKCKTSGCLLQDAQLGESSQERADKWRDTIVPPPSVAAGADGGDDSGRAPMLDLVDKPVKQVIAPGGHIVYSAFCAHTHSQPDE